MQRPLQKKAALHGGKSAGGDFVQVLSVQKGNDVEVVVRVIKKGNGRDWWVGRQVKCRNCSSLIELEAGDAVFLYTNPSLAAYFTCPECEEENKVEPTQT